MAKSSSESLRLRRLLTISSPKTDRRGRQQNHFYYALNRSAGINYRRWLNTQNISKTLEQEQPNPVTNPTVEDIVLNADLEYDTEKECLNIYLTTESGTFNGMAFQFNFDIPLHTPYTSYVTGTFITGFNIVNNLNGIHGGIINGYTILSSKYFSISNNTFSHDVPVLSIKTSNPNVNLKGLILTDLNGQSFHTDFN